MDYTTQQKLDIIQKVNRLLILYRGFFELTRRSHQPVAMGETLTMQFVDAFREVVTWDQTDNLIAYLLRVSPKREHAILKPLTFALKYNYYPLKTVSTEWDAEKIISVECVTLTNWADLHEHMWALCGN